MLSVSEIVAKTEAMFDLFNHHFYNDELTRPAITVSPDGGRGAYGWCSVYEIWQASGEAYREINICAEYIDRPIGEVAATMLHDMQSFGKLLPVLCMLPEKRCQFQRQPHRANIQPDQVLQRSQPPRNRKQHSAHS